MKASIHTRPNSDTTNTEIVYNRGRTRPGLLPGLTLGNTVQIEKCLYVRSEKIDPGPESRLTESVSSPLL